MSRQPRRRGNMLSEYLFTFPLLLLLVAGGFEFGWAILRSVQIDHAARLGVRTASLSGATQVDIEDRINAALSRAGISGHSIEFEPADPESTEAGELVTVRISVPYENLRLLGFGKWFPQPTTLHGRASMIREPDA